MIFKFPHFQNCICDKAKEFCFFLFFLSVTYIQTPHEDQFGFNYSAVLICKNILCGGHRLLMLHCTVGVERKIDTADFSCTTMLKLGGLTFCLFVICSY